MKIIEITEMVDSSPEQRLDMYIRRAIFQTRTRVPMEAIQQAVASKYNNDLSQTSIDRIVAIIKKLERVQ